MDSQWKFIEEINDFELTSGAAIDVLQFEEYEQDIIFDMLGSIPNPGKGVYDKYAVVLDDKICLEVKLYGDTDELFIVYNISDIHNVDDYLDYINSKKVIKWNTDMMMSTRL